MLVSFDLIWLHDSLILLLHIPSYLLYIYLHISTNLYSVSFHLIENVNFQNWLKYCFPRSPKAKKTSFSFHILSFFKKVKCPIKLNYCVSESGKFWQYSNDSKKQQ